MEPIDIALKPKDFGGNNIYVLPTEEGLVLIDCGWNYSDARERFCSTLATRGFTPSQVRAVLITHAHIDHAAFGYRLKTEYGAEIMIHQREAKILAEGEVGMEARDQHARRLMIQHGVPRELSESNITPFQIRQWMATLPRRIAGPEHEERGSATERPQSMADWLLPPVTPDRALKDEEVLTFGSLSLEAIYCPGHTPGSTVYYHQPSGSLFSGDHLLKGLTPCPMIEFPEGTFESRTLSLPSYLESLEKIRHLPVTRIYTGHGDELDDLPHLVETMRLHHQGRGEKILQFLGSRAISSYQVLPHLFPNLHPSQLWYAMCEVIGHLDVLVDKGDVVAEYQGDLILHRRR